ncbi:MAG: NUDIX domain-containing protein [Chitinophagaceae bacterium]|nr:NUDIX domain-containing protein [Chitinophagaceae bacterium]MCA6475345.1 NUDIX domain-containing protein [Chitinophagaceae bacterium]MCA6477109.1 NUDIX domain-containing protein [Chitinophagaceae bacterium]MCA6496632.1 NUDIX domain-containing protein [Chitinophagaceae bacterium]
MALFNVRVYGILLWPEQGLLVSDEFIKGQYITKLPGGGLEIGEGTRDCLQREFMEETGLQVTVGEHIYTTDFYQLSAFNQRDQIISVYYRVHHEGPIQLEVKQRPFDFAPHQTADVSLESEVFRWIPQEQIHPDCMTLPIDKVVMDIIRQQVR